MFIVYDALAPLLDVVGMWGSALRDALLARSLALSSFYVLFCFVCLECERFENGCIFRQRGGFFFFFCMFLDLHLAGTLTLSRKQKRDRRAKLSQSLYIPLSRVSREFRGNQEVRHVVVANATININKSMPPPCHVGEYTGTSLLDFFVLL